LSEAIINYRKASRIKPLGFADRMNLLTCFLTLDRMQESVGLIIQMAKDGYGMSFLNDKKYEQLINEENWIYFVHHEYQAPGISVYAKNISGLATNFGSVYEQPTPKMLEIILPLVSENITKLIFENGYPGEPILGYGGNKRTEVLLYDMLSKCMKSGYLKYDTLYNDQFLKGKMEPEMIVSLLGNNGNSSCGCEPQRGKIYLQIRNKLYSCTEKQEQMANFNRAKYFMPTIADTKKMIEFSIHNESGFRLRAYASSLDYYYFPAEDKQVFDIDNYSDQLQLIKIIDQN